MKQQPLRIPTYFIISLLASHAILLNAVIEAPTPKLETATGITYDLTTSQLIAKMIDDEKSHITSDSGNATPTGDEREDRVIDTKGNSYLHWIVRVGDNQQLIAILQKAANENWIDTARNLQNNNGLSLLHTAAMYGHTLAAQTLALFDFDIESQDKWGNLPVHYACLFSPDKYTVTHFLDKTPDHQEIPEMGLTPLAILILRGHTNLAKHCIETLKMPTDYAIILNNVGSFFTIFPHLRPRKEEFVANHYYGLVSLAQAVGDDTIVESLVSHNAPLTQVHKLIESPSQTRDRSVLSTLKLKAQLALGVQTTDYRGNSPLSRSIKDKKDHMLFLTHGSPPNWLHPKTNASAIHMAVAQGNLLALKTLLDDPTTDPNIQMWENQTWEKRGKTPLMLALSNTTVPDQPLILSTLLEDPRVHKGFLTRDTQGRTPLHFASQNSIFATSSLINLAPDETTRNKMICAKDNNGRNPLTYARLTLGEDSEKIASYLTEIGAPIQELPAIASGSEETSK